jgi:hypothetical protein
VLGYPPISMPKNDKDDGFLRLRYLLPSVPFVTAVHLGHINVWIIPLAHYGPIW